MSRRTSASGGMPFFILAGFSWPSLESHPNKLYLPRSKQLS